jgi:hypothetical protein
MAKKKDPKENGKEVVILSPGNHTKVDGKIFYSEGDQCWNLIRLRKEVLHEFPELKKKSVSFGYTMIIPKSKEGFKEILLGMEKEAIPILLFLNKVAQQEG